MGASQRAKGNRVEREFVTAIKELGLRAERVPLSGASHFRGCGHDVDVYRAGDEFPLCGEIKARKEIPAWLSGWLGDNDFLAIKEDRAEPLIVLPWRVWARLLNPQNKENLGE